MKHTRPIDNQSKRKHEIEILPTIGWVILVVGVIFSVNQTLRSLMVNSEKPTEERSAQTDFIDSTPVLIQTNVATPIPTQAGYNWEGTMLYFDVPFPDNPGQAMVYQLQPDKAASEEIARMLAQQFGLQGEIYEIPPEENYTGKVGYLVMDGNQRLRINSDRDFDYSFDSNRSNHQESDSETRQAISQLDAEKLIDGFLSSHGFDSPYEVKTGEFSGDFYTVPRTPDRFAIRTSFFSPIGFSFRFDADRILSVSAKLLDYQPIDRYKIISPDTALQRVTEHNTIYGVYVFTNSGNPPVTNWQRSYPKNQSVTVWGPVSSTNSVDGRGTLVTVDGYQATGNIAGLADVPSTTFIEATGQIQDVNGIETFNIENWQLHNIADWEAGNIRRDGGQVIFTNSKINGLVLPDIPADLPLPFQNAFVRGIIRGDVFDWKYIDDHLQSGKGQGGGGFISRFHKLNLGGTPLPLATSTPDPNNTATAGGTNYSGQTGMIEEAELAYYVPDPRRYLPGLGSTDPAFIQPVWRFYGHFSGGDEFEILVQALKDEFLSPELEEIEP